MSKKFSSGKINPKQTNGMEILMNLTGPFFRMISSRRGCLFKKGPRRKVLKKMHLSLRLSLTPLGSYRFGPCTDNSRKVMNFWTVVEQEMYIREPFFSYQAIYLNKEISLICNELCSSLLNGASLEYLRYWSTSHFQAQMSCQYDA